MAKRKMLDPRKRVTTKTYRETLKAINEIRVALGSKPLKRIPNGVPSNGEFCPIANALSPHLYFNGETGKHSEVRGAGIKLVAPHPFGAEGDSNHRDGCDGEIIGWSNQLTDDEIFDTFCIEFDRPN